MYAGTKNWNDAIAQAQQGVFLNPRSALANIVVGRIFDLAGKRQVDLGKAVIFKMLYNTTRPHKHGKTC